MPSENTENRKVEVHKPPYTSAAQTTAYRARKLLALVVLFLVALNVGVLVKFGLQNGSKPPTTTNLVLNPTLTNVAEKASTR